MLAYQDPNHRGNSPKYRTGDKCRDCDQPAGTWWSPLWCFECNVKRMDRIDRQLKSIAKSHYGIEI